MSGFRGLALETSSRQATVAACRGERLARVQLADAQGSSRHIYAAVREALGEVELQPAELDCVAFGCGPGSFTGVRVATSAAQALAYAAQKPVVGVSSLASVARAAWHPGAAVTVAVCVDARMGEIYTAVYALDAGGMLECVQADALWAPGDWQPEGRGRQLIAAGSGWQAFPELLERHAVLIEAVHADLWPDATHCLALAAQEFARGGAVDARDVQPNYVRDQVTR